MKPLPRCEHDVIGFCETCAEIGAYRVDGVCRCSEPHLNDARDFCFDCCLPAKATIEQASTESARAEGYQRGYIDGQKVGRYEAYEVATDEVRLYAQRLASRLSGTIYADDPVPRAPAPKGDE